MPTYIYNSKRRAALFSDPKKKRKRSNGEAIIDNFKYLADALVSKGINNPVPTPVVELYLYFTRVVKIFARD